MTEFRHASTGLPVFEGPPVSEAVSLQAVQWLVALQACDAGEDTQASWRRWRADHPDHERAWRHIEACGLHLRDLPAPLAHGALQPRHSRARGRRQAMKLLALAAFTGSSAWWIQGGDWREWSADHRTATGERQALTLADGTRIHLNTASAIDVRFDASQRLLRLLGGEVLVTTASDPQARPFLVETAQGRLRALGTRFAVRQRDGASHVAVYEGAVEVRPANAPQAVRILAAGEQAGFDRLAVDVPQPADELAAAWSTGLLAARDMPLTDFIAELARHRRGRLACDPALASLRVSGMYPLDDTDRVLDMLVRTQPIELTGFGRYWLTVRARQNRT